MAATNVQAFSGDVEITSNLAVNTDVLFVNSIGNRVGIGTTEPDKKLHIYTTAGEGNTQLYLESESRYSTIQMLDDTGAILFGNDRGDFRFITGHDTSISGGSEAMRITGNGNVGIGTNDPTATLDIYKEDTTAAGQTVISSITGVFSGSDATGGNVNNKGLFINLDSSATGGTLTVGEEHRLWGIDVDIDVTGDSDDIKGGRFLVRSDLAANGTDRVTNIYGIDAQAHHDGSAPSTNIIGVFGRSLKASSSTGLTTRMIGVDTEYEINAGTCTDAYGVRARFDRNGGAVSNSYIFYGDHIGSTTTITNNYGLYVTDVDKHYLEGNVGIGTTDPECLVTSFRLDVYYPITDPVKIKIHNRTITGGWSITQPWGLLEFDTDDSSGAGSGPVAGIGCRAESQWWHASLCFYTDGDNSDDSVLGPANERMCIDSAGNVGIGVTDPGAKLDVSGTIRGTQVLVGTGGDLGLTINDGGGNANLTFNHANRTPDQDGSSARITSAVDGNTGDLTFSVKDDVTAGTVINLVNTMRMRETYVQAFADFYVDGNVGIGTDDPVGVNGGRRLEGLSTTGFEYIATRDDATSSAGDFIGAYLFKNTDASGTEPHYAGIAAKDPVTFGHMDLHFYTGRDNYENDTPQMTINEDGNVGIGTTSPGEKLQIVGDSAALTNDPSVNNYGQLSLGSSSNYTGGSKPTQLKIGVDHTAGGFGKAFIQGIVDYVNSSVDLLLCHKGGAVGIGTTSPAEKLHIQGQTRFVGSMFGYDYSEIKFYRGTDTGRIAGYLTPGYNSMEIRGAGGGGYDASMKFGQTGQATQIYASTTITEGSDDRIKYREEERVCTEQLYEDFKRLKVYRYEKFLGSADNYESNVWIPTDEEWEVVRLDEETPKTEETGVIAQELLALQSFAEDVGGSEYDENGKQNIYGVAYHHIFLKTIPVVQRLIQEIETLKIRVETLENV
jgi:hypothetical protein